LIENDLDKAITLMFGLMLRRRAANRSADREAILPIESIDPLKASPANLL